MNKSSPCSFVHRIHFILQHFPRPRRFFGKLKTFFFWRFLADKKKKHKVQLRRLQQLLFRCRFACRSCNIFLVNGGGGRNSDYKLFAACGQINKYNKKIRNTKKPRESRMLYAYINTFFSSGIELKQRRNLQLPLVSYFFFICIRSFVL